MFQGMIFKTIQGIKNLYEKLDSAYQKTYTDKTTANKAYEEIEYRKRQNKKIFIKKTMDFARRMSIQENGFPMDEIMQRLFAEKMYETAKRRGDLDMLNNFCWEENKDNE